MRIRCSLAPHLSTVRSVPGARAFRMKRMLPPCSEIRPANSETRSLPLEFSPSVRSVTTVLADRTRCRARFRALSACRWSLLLCPTSRTVKYWLGQVTCLIYSGETMKLLERTPVSLILLPEPPRPFESRVRSSLPFGTYYQVWILTLSPRLLLRLSDTVCRLHASRLFSTTSCARRVGKAADSNSPFAFHSLHTFQNHRMFCPGTTNLPDGSILITGGTSDAKVTIYNPWTDTWRAATEMNVGRGYHVQLPLSNGDVFALGGSWSGAVGGKYGEVFSPATETWTPKPGIPANGSIITADPEGKSSGSQRKRGL